MSDQTETPILRVTPERGSTAWYVARYTERHGMQIVPIRPKTKRPLSDDWNLHASERPKTKPNGRPTEGPGLLVSNDEAVRYYLSNPDHNVGFALGESGYCSLDIDCIESFRTLLEDFGLTDEYAELSSIPTVQGDPKGMRLIFRVPDGVSLGYGQLTWPHRDDPTGARHREMMMQAKAAREAGNESARVDIIEKARKIASYTVFELRSVPTGENKARYDMLPPSIHNKTGKPYVWLSQPARTRDEWPVPPAWLLAVWEAWEDFAPQFVQSCPWAPDPKPRAPSRPAPPSRDGEVSIIQHHIDNTDLREELARYGYVARGSRFLSPFSSSRIAGVEIDSCGNRCYIHHASDPLTGRPVNAFDLCKYFDHGDDAGAAVRALAERYGLSRRSKPRQLPPPIDDRSAPSGPPRHDAPPPSEPPHDSDDDGMGPLPDMPRPIVDQRQSASSAKSDPRRRGAGAALHSIGAPFRPLGYSHGYYYYLPDGTEQVASVSDGQHTNAGKMFTLAVMEWWVAHFPKDPDKPERGIDWQSAVSVCMEACKEVGVYDERRIRGRGAWSDEGRSIIHMGHHLLVDGIETSIRDHASHFIYQKEYPIEVSPLPEPLSDKEGAELAALFSRLYWRTPLDGQLALGWAVLAVICGALEWRPHMWLTAQRGAGKSWFYNQLLLPLLGQIACMVQSSSTEAGLRQSLRQDARPVPFEEGESEGKKSRDIMQGILELARASSTETDAEIVKGTTGGTSMSFRVRSMFFLVSVNVSLTMAADQSRFTLVQLNTPPKHPEAVKNFNVYAADVAATLKPEFCARFRARSYALAPVIKQNARTFAQAVAEVTGSQRSGDQLGALIAGSASLHRSDIIDIDTARDWVSKLDLGIADESDQISDEMGLLAVILEHSVSLNSSHGTERMSLGELIEAAAKRDMLKGVSYEEAGKVIARYGLVVRGQSLFVSNTHTALKRILNDSPWGGGWRHVLARIPGAAPSEKSIRFAGSSTRAVEIPLEAAIGPADTEELDFVSPM